MTETEKTLGENKQEGTSATPAKGNQKDVTAQQLEALQTQLRNMQATKDREVAEAKRAADAYAAQIKQLREQMEALISDPAAKQEFKAKRMEAELDAYKAKEGINQHRQLLNREYGVPLNELEVTDDPAQMTDLALRYWRKQSESRNPQKDEKIAELETLQAAGGHDVSTAPGTVPNTASASLTEIEREIRGLREEARKGGRSGEAARIKILQLKEKESKPVPTKTRL